MNRYSGQTFPGFLWEFLKKKSKIYIHKLYIIHVIHIIKCYSITWDETKNIDTTFQIIKHIHIARNGLFTSL